VQIKGTKSGLLLHVYERPLAGAVAELRERLSGLPGFYKGSRAVLMLGSEPAQAPELAAIVATLEQFGIIPDGAVCEGDELAALVRSAGLRIVTASVAAAPRLRDDRTAPVKERDANGRTGPQYRNGRLENAGAQLPAGPEASEFHKGTLRSGQSITCRGDIVVLGDVNAGAELVAAGDIIVWGALRGMAHAGAEGDDSAAVFALRLEPMQLRISRCIATAPAKEKRRHKRTVLPEKAFIRDGRIAIASVRA
jgi:septum site-determining protein MinC